MSGMPRSGLGELAKETLVGSNNGIDGLLRSRSQPHALITLNDAVGQP
jgi:hypothetical protein